MADPQHPAVPFEQAVDLLTGEPRPLRPQHPDIAALVEELGGYANLLRMLHPKQNEKSAALVDRTIAALRTLARPVEDEEAQEIAAWLDGSIRKERSTGHRGAAEMLEKIDRYLARLARQKASAEQEIDAAWKEFGPAANRDTLSLPEQVAVFTIECGDDIARAEQEVARLRFEVRKIVAVGANDRGYRAVEIAERALAAAAGAEEPRSAVPGAPSPRWRQISPETEAGLKALDEATRLGPHRARKMPPTGEEEPR